MPEDKDNQPSQKPEFYLRTQSPSTASSGEEDDEERLESDRTNYQTPFTKNNTNYATPQTHKTSNVQRPLASNVQRPFASLVPGRGTRTIVPPANNIATSVIHDENGYKLLPPRGPRQTYRLPLPTQAQRHYKPIDEEAVREELFGDSPKEAKEATAANRETNRETVPKKVPKNVGTAVNGTPLVTPNVAPNAAPNVAPNADPKLAAPKLVPKLAPIFAPRNVARDVAVNVPRIVGAVAQSGNIAANVANVEATGAKEEDEKMPARKTRKSMRDDPYAIDKYINGTADGYHHPDDRFVNHRNPNAVVKLPCGLPLSKAQCQHLQGLYGHLEETRGEVRKREPGDKASPRGNVVLPNGSMEKLGTI